MIPRTVMQTWKTHDVPEKWTSSPASVKRFMPNWDYILLSDNDNDAFVEEYFPDDLNFFRSLKYPIQRSDVVRYMWLYQFGGLYMDLDIELVSPLDELFENRHMETWLVKAPRNFAGHYTNFLMASTAKNPFWLKVLEECRKPVSYWCILPHLIISHQTGLGALSRAVNAWPHPIATLPFNSLVPCDYCATDHCSKPFTYTKFLKGQSWNGPDTMAMNFVSCHPEIFVLLIVLLLSVRYVYR
jgi:mannosyltransferase OCH1-like enzyme